MKVSKLSDVELNRAMIWLYMSRVNSFLDHNFKLGIEELSEADSINDNGCGLTIKLNNWEWSVEFLSGYLAYDLTMPLAAENGLTISTGFKPNSFRAGVTDGVYATIGTNPPKVDGWVFNKNPLRAVCEVLVTLAMERKL